jgi:hypothetical protein
MRTGDPENRPLRSLNDNKNRVLELLTWLIYGTTEAGITAQNGETGAEWVRNFR